jgi:hypothetical protein
MIYTAFTFIMYKIVINLYVCFKNITYYIRLL